MSSYWSWNGFHQFASMNSHIGTAKLTQMKPSCWLLPKPLGCLDNDCVKLVSPGIVCLTMSQHKARGPAGEKGPYESKENERAFGEREAWWQSQHLIVPQANMTESRCTVRASPSLLE